jgi:hypothetical protein
MSHQRRRLSIALAVLALALLLATRSAAAGGDPPRYITVRAPVRGVVCAVGVCCGVVEATYRGHTYDAGPRGYCRWLRPLGEGQLVTARLRLVW